MSAILIWLCGPLVRKHPSAGCARISSFSLPLGRALLLRCVCFRGLPP